MVTIYQDKTVVMYRSGMFCDINSVKTVFTVWPQETVWGG